MRHLLMVVAAALTTSAAAQTDARVFGIELGGPLNALPACAKEFSPPPPCQSPNKYFPDKPVLYGLPDIGVGPGASLRLDGDRIGGIDLTFEQYSFAKMAAILRERYGPPTSTQDMPVRTRSGANFSNQVLEWRGSKMTITAIERVGDITTSNVVFMENGYAAKLATEREQKTKGAASKL
jgi:hypothetical protein